jgi:hypothetical protein
MFKLKKAYCPFGVPVNSSKEKGSKKLPFVRIKVRIKF